MERYPLGSLMFIFSAGLFMVISFPFDLSSLISSDGVIVQDCVTFFAESGKNFKPFVNVNLLKADFVLGSTKIIIASLVVGFFFYMVSNLYEKLNHLVAKGKTKNAVFSRRKPKHANTQERMQKCKLLQLEFAEWLREFKLTKYTDFIHSVRRMLTGLIYASETFLGTIILVAIYVWFFEPSGHIYIQNVGSWLVVGFFICAFFYVLDIIYELGFKTEMESFCRDFLKRREREKKERDMPLSFLHACIS